MNRNEQAAAAAARMEEYVEFETPLTADPEERDILVSVNGETLRIRRGERVRIQRKFAEVLRAAEEQRRAAVRYQRQQQRGLSGSPLAKL